MNINHLSLFPDLWGSAHFCNTSLTVPDYSEPFDWIQEPDSPLQSLDAIRPPEPSADPPRGRELDRRTLLAFARADSGLQSLHARILAARGQYQMRKEHPGDEASHPLVGRLAEVGLGFTGTLRAGLASLDEEALVSLFLSVNLPSNGPVGELDLLGMLSFVIVARSSSFEDSRAFSVAKIPDIKEDLLRDFYPKARAIPPAITD
jgi:hypothetical protein